MYRGQHSQLQLRGPTPIQELSQYFWKIAQLNCCLFKIKNHSWNFSFELKLCKWVVWIPSQNKFNNLTDKNEIQNCLPGKDLVFCWSLQWEEPWHLGGIPHTVKLPVKRQRGLIFYTENATLCMMISILGLVQIAYEHVVLASLSNKFLS